MTSSESLKLDRFPMRRGGGAFLACVGVAIIASAFDAPNVQRDLAIGAALGIILLVLVIRLQRRHGGARATPLQIGLLFAAIAIEFIVFWKLYPLVPPDQRLRVYVALGIVAGHFLLMAWSFGPMIVYLALALLVWLAATYWALPEIGLNVVIGGDGGLKLLFGLAMLMIG
ncbi:MAG: DUF6609 family protein [Alphaproteobacteria bacterium]